MVQIHPHAYKHRLSESEILYAWSNPVVFRFRDASESQEVIILIGCLPDTRLCELVAYRTIEGMWCIFHAMAPPTKKFIREVQGES